MCPEVHDSDETFGHYVGHDEASLMFYSHKAGSGNRLQWSGIIPTDPSPTNPRSKSYNFELSGAYWFGLPMCDTQSYPLTVKTCTPDSDTNATPPTDPNHAGTAFTEVQFYAPGYVRQFDGYSCSATEWCVALNIDSLSKTNTGVELNDACQNIAGVEPVNFAYLTHDGKPQGPVDPVNFDPVRSGNPDPKKVLFLRPGDHYTLTMSDTPHGLDTEVDDLTTHQKGSMTASAANGFKQVKFAPNPSKRCDVIPYDFHPMYSTSTTQTVVPWTSERFGVAFDMEIGHFDFCSNVKAPAGSCSGNENGGRSHDPDDTYCFGPESSTLVRVGGCLDANVGFDGSSYQPIWPNGDLQHRAGPTIFSSPRTGTKFDVGYSQVGFWTDLPALEEPGDSPQNNCNITTGSGCTRIPIADYHGPAKFYPYYSSGPALGGCAWTIGQDVAGFTTNNYGRNGQYGPLYKSGFNVGGHKVDYRYDDFAQILPNNPCT